MSKERLPMALTIGVVAGCLSGCSAGSPSVTPQSAVTATVADRQEAPARASKITHVVIMVQENRSFDNLFATFPGADGATTRQTPQRKDRPAKEAQPLVVAISSQLSATLSNRLRRRENGRFRPIAISTRRRRPAMYPYQYVNPAQIQPYWTMAQQYVLADHMFQTQGSGSFTAHQDLIAGATADRFERQHHRRPRRARRGDATRRAGTRRR